MDQLELNIVLCIDYWYILFKDIVFYNAYPKSTKEFSCNQLLVDRQVLRWSYSVLAQPIFSKFGWDYLSGGDNW